MNLMLGLVVSAVLLSLGGFILGRMSLEGTVLVHAHAYCQTVFLYFVTFLGSVALASRQ